MFAGTAPSQKQRSIISVASCTWLHNQAVCTMQVACRSTMRSVGVCKGVVIGTEC